MRKPKGPTVNDLAEQAAEQGMEIQVSARPREEAQDLARALRDRLDGARCRMRGEISMIGCELASKHVRGPDDWHEVVMTSHSVRSGPGYSVVMDTKETIRWAPMSFEYPKGSAASPAATTTSDATASQDAGDR